jgi:hypothetical protein
LPEHKQVSPDYSIKELWTRGKLYEIFGLMSSEFTALELAKEYSRLLKIVRDPEEEQILEDAFAVLNAPFTRQFYEGCRMIMGQIKREISDTEYEEFEDKIWTDVWGWVSQKWQPLPDELIRVLVIKYGGTAKVAASSSRTFVPPSATAQPRHIGLERKRRKNWIIAGSVLGSITAIILMVSLCTSSPPPVLDVDSSPIYFSNLKPFTIADAKLITISNTGGGTLSGTLTADKNWLSISPAEIKVGKDANQVIRVRADTTGLKYKFSDTGFITIKTNGGEKQIPVKLTTLVFEDDFSNPNSGWWVASEAGAKAEYLDGRYRLLHKEGGYVRWVLNLAIGQLDDFALEVDAQWYGTSSFYNYYGAIFKEQGVDNCYVFGVNSDAGQYFIDKKVKGAGSELKGWTESIYIKKGTAVNRIKVICQGSKISVYANDSLLTTVYDDSLSKGDIGLMVGKGKSTSSWITVPDADALFDNLKISVP